MQVGDEVDLDCVVIVNDGVYGIVKQGVVIWTGELEDFKKLMYDAIAQKRH